ncbi:prepilin-type N-terminal cleavage/methylation domain-containing protein (plasmid) [Enterobacteriaceae bacterium Kacie_13]|nr:prepilin-type N-terminal cleavage/methylation domain-containing protein [Enterobacteriaceae bacterium Kacie_13]
MSAISEHKRLARQQGMTLFEMLLVIAMIGLMTALMMNWSLSALHSKDGADVTQREFSTWYTQMRHSALYSSQLYRICLNGRRAEREVYSRESGWQKSDVFFLPRPGVSLSITNDKCSGVLNAGDDSFLQRVKFNDEK